MESGRMIRSLVVFPNEKDVGKKSFVKPIKDDGVLSRAPFVGIMAVNGIFVTWCKRKNEVVLLCESG